MSEPGLDFLEVVYYSAPVPSSRAALTMLSFVFDRIHFPGVYLPPRGMIDKGETQKERERLIREAPRDIGSSQFEHIVLDTISNSVE
jgi:hypothetical protein